jgi:hypothetical protein
MLSLSLFLACTDPTPPSTDATSTVPTGTVAPAGLSTPPATPSGTPAPASPPNGGPAAGNAAANAPTSMALPPSATCDALAADKTVPQNEAELKTHLAGGQTWTDEQIRNTYLCAIARITGSDSAAKAAGKTAEQRAEAAFAVRHDARVLARGMIKDAARVASLKQADQEKFGNPDGPTFEHLVEKAKEKGVAGDALYEDVVQVIESRPDLDRALGL